MTIEELLKSAAKDEVKLYKAFSVDTKLTEKEPCQLDLDIGMDLYATDPKTAVMVSVMYGDSSERIRSEFESVLSRQVSESMSELWSPFIVTMTKDELADLEGDYSEGFRIERGTHTIPVIYMMEFTLPVWDLIKRPQCYKSDLVTEVPASTSPEHTIWLTLMGREYTMGINVYELTQYAVVYSSEDDRMELSHIHLTPLMKKL